MTNKSFRIYQPPTTRPSCFPYFTQTGKALLLNPFTGDTPIVPLLQVWKDSWRDMPIITRLLSPFACQTKPMSHLQKYSVKKICRGCYLIGIFHFLKHIALLADKRSTLWLVGERCTFRVIKAGAFGFFVDLLAVNLKRCLSCW